MDDAQSLDKKYVREAILPLTVIKSNPFLFFIFVGIPTFMVGAYVMLHYGVPIYSGEVDLVYLAQVKVYLASWVCLLTPLIFIFGACRQIKSSGKFILKEDSVELFSYDNLGFSTSDIKKTVWISPDKDFLSIETIQKPIKGKIAVVLHLEELKASRDKELRFNLFPSFDDAHKFALNLHLELKLSTPIKMA